MDKLTAMEEQISSLPNKTIIQKIQEKIKILEMEVEELGTKKDIQYICSELDKYEKEISKLKSFIVSQGEVNDKYKDDITKIKNQFDNIKKTFSAINKLF
jgi:DNA gyrase/topoisomerase IV subunit A